jgi:hypothetical protein
MDNAAIIEKLRGLAQKWGGELVELSRDDFDTRFGGKDSQTVPKGLSQAPFSSHDLGICWSKKQVIFGQPAEWHEIVHEMGHIFACKQRPYKSKEWNFFGWEYALALYVGGRAAAKEWTAANKDYGISDFKFRDGQLVLKHGSWDFGGCTPEQREDILAERLAFAKNKGLVAEDGTPLAIR